VIAVRKWPTAVLLAFTLALGACGGDDDKKSESAATPTATATPTPTPTPTDEENIQALVEDFSAALLGTDGETACDLLTDDAIKDLTPGGDRNGCVEAIDAAGEATEENRKQLENPQVTDLQVDGDSATALVETEGNDDMTRTKFKRVEGEWKIDGDE
jgi:ketosteroid isomerase-like protein